MTTQSIKQETQDLISKCLGYKDALFYTTLNEPYGSWVHFNSLAMQADITDWLRIEKNIPIYCYPIYYSKKLKYWKFSIENNSNLYLDQREFETLEDACEAAIVYTFQNETFN